MQKIKSKLQYVLGGSIAFLYQKAKIQVSEAGLLYGVEGMRPPPPEPSLLEKITNLILSPFIITIFVILVFTIGTFVFIKQRRKKLKKLKTKKNAKNKK